MRDLLIRLVKDDDHDHSHHGPHHHDQVGGDVNLGGEGHDGLPAVDPVPQVLRHLLRLMITQPPNIHSIILSQ